MILKTNNMLKFLIISIFILNLIFTCPISVAESYYADIQINVYETGLVDIEGNSNHPDLIVEKTNLYTYKKQSYWLLNITKNDVFDDYVYTLTLPEGSTVNHIKASGLKGIAEEEGRLIISGAGQNEALSITVQYQINTGTNEYSLTDYIILSILVILIILLTALLLYYILNKKNKKTLDSKVDDKLVGYSLKGLSSRQKEIIRLLVDKKRPLTQTDIQKELDIPKAAVSRNIHSLEIKGLVEIEKIGMSNLVRLKKP